MDRPPATNFAAPPQPIPPVCGECGYRLTGLPTDGACPECGSPYRPHLIVIAGWGSDSKESAANATPERFVKALVGGVLGLILLAVHNLFRRRFTPAAWDFSFAAVLCLIGVYQRWRLNNGTVAPAHVRLFPTGFAQRNGFGPCDLHPWSTAHHVTLEPTPHHRHRLQITSRTVMTVPVSIEFECTSDQADWLRQRVFELQHAVKK